jgi:hypothetical protein
MATVLEPEQKKGNGTKRRKTDFATGSMWFFCNSRRRSCVPKGKPLDSCRKRVHLKLATNGVLMRGRREAR